MTNLPYTPQINTEQPLNVWAVVAAALAFFPILCPAILLLGHVALREIGRTGNAGSKLAVFALVMGYLYLIPFAIIAITLVSALLLT